MPQVTALGVYQRAYPRLNVLRGWDPTNPSQRARRNAVTRNAGTFKQGHLISYSTSTSAWTLGVTAGFLTGGGIPYVAMDDDTEYNVMATGLLTGISYADNYRYQTPFFTGDPATFVPGTQVTPDGTTGNVKVAGTTDYIIGYVAQEGVVELAPTYSGSANTRAIGYTFTLPDGTTETVGNLVVTIDTQLQKTASIS